MNAEEPWCYERSVYPNGNGCEALIKASGSINPCIFPKHEAGLTLSHNEHKGYYMTVSTTIDEGIRYDQWVSEEQRQKAIDTDECWMLQWYPITPIGSYTLCAADLDALMDAVAAWREANE